jgi:hypothetical protein
MPAGGKIYSSYLFMPGYRRTSSVSIKSGRDRRGGE